MHPSVYTSLTLLLILGGLAGSASAAKVYKWVDEQGKVHYGGRPPPGTDADRVRVRESQGSAAQPATDTERRAQQRKLLKAFEDDRKERETRKAEVAKEAARRDASCAKLAKYIADEAKAKFLYRKNPETGDKVPVSDKERAAHMARTKQHYDENC